MTPVGGFKIGYHPDVSWNKNADPSYVSVREVRYHSFLGFKWTSETTPKHYDLVDSSARALQLLEKMAKPLQTGQLTKEKLQENAQELHIKASAYAAVYKSHPEIVKEAQNITNTTKLYIPTNTLYLLDNALDKGLENADVRRLGGIQPQSIKVA